MNARLLSRCVAVAVLAWTSTACGAFHRSDVDIAGKNIRYQVGYLNNAGGPSGPTALSITYATPDGMQELHGVGLPWTIVVDAAGGGFTPSVTAQLDGFGTIECRIIADSEVVAGQTSTQAPYPEVECSA